MLKMIDSNRAVALLATMAMLTVPHVASGLSLSNLVEGGELWSDDGSVQFSGFEVDWQLAIGEEDNALANFDLTLVDVTVHSTGVSHVLQIVGPFETGPEELGHLRIGYDVEAAPGFEIIQIDLGVEAALGEQYGLFELQQKITGDHEAGLAASLGIGADRLRDRSEVAPGANAVHVESELFVMGADVSRVDQTFEVRGPAAAVPEPGSALLFGAGLLIAMRRVRR